MIKAMNKMDMFHFLTNLIPVTTVQIVRVSLSLLRPLTQTEMVQSSIIQEYSRIFAGVNSLPNNSLKPQSDVKEGHCRAACIPSDSEDVPDKINPEIAFAPWPLTSLLSLNLPSMSFHVLEITLECKLKVDLSSEPVADVVAPSASPPSDSPQMSPLSRTVTHLSRQHSFREASWDDVAVPETVAAVVPESPSETQYFNMVEWFSKSVKLQFQVSWHQMLLRTLPVEKDFVALGNPIVLNLSSVFFAASVDAVWLLGCFNFSICLSILRPH
jgi:hypothetical protein